MSVITNESETRWQHWSGVDDSNGVVQTMAELDWYGWQYWTNTDGMDWYGWQY